MKIFERLIRDKVMSLCENKINDKQHGFLPAKSCLTQMIPFFDSLAITINDLSTTDVIYFDFAKAFDSVNHDIILHKLKYHFHVDGLLLKFLTNYLMNRLQAVVIGVASQRCYQYILVSLKVQFLDHYFLSYLLMIFPIV